MASAADSKRPSVAGSASNNFSNVHGSNASLLGGADVPDQQQPIGPSFIETTPESLALINDFNSNTSTFKNLDFVTTLYKAYLIPYTKERVESSAFLSGSTSNAWILQRILSQSHNPLANTGSDRMVLYDEYRYIRLALAAALGVLIEDGEYDCHNIGLVDTFLEAMSLAAQQSWTALQLQQFLRLLQQTHSDITWIQKPSSSSTSDENEGKNSQQRQQHQTASTTSSKENGSVIDDEEIQLKTVVGNELTKRLSRLCAKQHVPGFEKFVVTETVVEEVTDPQAVAALEAKMKDAKGKQKQNMADAIAQLPKIKVSNSVTKESVVEKTVVIDPYFSTVDAVEIVSFIRNTLLQHWRLYRYAATVPRSVDTQDVHLFVEDLPRKLDRLQDAVTQQCFEQTNERKAFWDAMVNEIEADFDANFTQKIDEIYKVFVEEDTVAREQNDREVAEDEAHAMNREEFQRSVQVLKHRLGKSLGGKKEAGQQQEEETTTADLDEMEERIKKLEAAIVAQAAPPAGGGKAGKK